MTATSALAPHATIMTVTAVATGLHQKYEIAIFDLCMVELILHPNARAADILDTVAARLKLSEKQYFGLYFLDKQSNRRCWLALNRQLAEQELPLCTAADISRGTCVRLYFDVRFYTEGVSYLRDSITIELFFHSARWAVCEGRVECSAEIAFGLAAHALQATAGDHVTDELAMAHTRKMRLLCPATMQRERLSAEQCEQRVLTLYRGLRGQTRGDSVASYMNTVEKQATYGVAYYEVTDVVGNACCLGLSCYGLVVCDLYNKRSLQRVFLWKHLENLYIRDRKFTIEIYDPKRVTHILSSFNPYENAIHEAAEEFDDLSDALCEPTTLVSTSRRTFGPKSTNVYAWFAADAKQAKTIWTEAVCQRQFYQENRQHQQVHQARPMGEVAAQVTAAAAAFSAVPTEAPTLLLPPLQPSGVSASALRSVASESSRQDIIKSTAPLPTIHGVDNFTEKQAKRRRKLSQRRDELREALKVALQELRDVCLQEAALTGSVPPEYPSMPGEQPPSVPRRVRTAFTITVGDGKPEVSREERAVRRLEVHYELQKQIAKATLRLVNDTSLPGVVRRKHKSAYERLCSQVNDLELELHKAVQRMAVAGNADLSSLSSGFSEDVGADINDDIKSLSRHSSPLPSYHSTVATATATSHISRVTSSPQLQQSLLDDRSGSGSATPPPLMPRLSSSNLIGGSSSSASISSHQRRRHLSGGAATDRLKSTPIDQPQGARLQAVTLAGDIGRGEQRSQSPAPVLVPRSSAGRLQQQQPTGGNPQRPPRVPCSASLTDGQMRSLQLADWQQHRHIQPPAAAAAAAATARLRPAKAGSCDDLLAVDSLPAPDPRYAGGSSSSIARNTRAAREMLSASNPYGSLERRRPRAVDRHGTPMPHGSVNPIAQAQPPIAYHSQRPPASDTQPARDRLLRVLSSPLPLQQSERKAIASAVAAEAAGRRQRHTGVVPHGGSDDSSPGADVVAGPEPAHGGGSSASGRRTPSVFVSQPTIDLPPAEPVPPLLPRTSRRLLSGGGSSSSDIGHKQAATTSPAAATAIAGPSPGPTPSAAEQLYDAYAAKLSRASQRLYEMKSGGSADLPPGQRPPGRQSSSHALADQVGVASIGGGGHVPLGRRSALPLPGSDVDFAVGSGSSRSGSSRSSSPGGACNSVGPGSNGGGGGNGNGSVMRSHSQELLGPSVRQAMDSMARAGTPTSGRPTAAGRLPLSASGTLSSGSLGAVAVAGQAPLPAPGRWVGYDHGIVSDVDGVAGHGRSRLQQQRSADGSHEKQGSSAESSDSGSLLHAPSSSTQPRHETMTLVYGRYQPPMASGGSREAHHASAHLRGTAGGSAPTGGEATVAYSRPDLSWHDQSFDPTSGPSKSTSSSPLPQVSTLV